jgi:carbonic anhydrase
LVEPIKPAQALLTLTARVETLHGPSGLSLETVESSIQQPSGASRLSLEWFSDGKALWCPSFEISGETQEQGGGFLVTAIRLDLAASLENPPALSLSYDSREPRIGMFNDGRELRVEPFKPGNYVEIDGEYYDWKWLAWRPKPNGKSEMLFAHQNAANQWVMLRVEVVVANGAAHQRLDELLRAAPSHKEFAAQFTEPFAPGDLMPADTAFALSTGPTMLDNFASPIEARWFDAEKPLEVSEERHEAFQALFSEK